MNPMTDLVVTLRRVLSSSIWHTIRNGYIYAGSGSRSGPYLAPGPVVLHLAHDGVAALLLLVQLGLALLALALRGKGSSREGWGGAGGRGLRGRACAAACGREGGEVDGIAMWVEKGHNEVKVLKGVPAN